MNIELRKNAQKAGNAYGRDVFVDGKYAATWRANSSREWTLYVNQYGVIRHDKDEAMRGSERPIRAYALDQLSDVFKRAYERGKIPTEEAVQAIVAERKAKDEKYKKHLEEEHRLERIRQAGPEMLDVLLWLTKRGGLGIDVHERIDAVVAKATGH